MNYFQEYERIKKAKGSIQVGSKWIITQSTTGSRGSNVLGRGVIVRSISMNTIEYSYESQSSFPFLCDFSYERPIEVFKRTFFPIP